MYVNKYVNKKYKRLCLINLILIILNKIQIFNIIIKLIYFEIKYFFIFSCLYKLKQIIILKKFKNLVLLLFKVIKLCFVKKKLNFNKFKFITFRTQFTNMK